MLENSFNKKESPLVGMMGGGPGGPLGISGGAASDPIYVDDVFSTFLYTGTGSSNSPQSINLGIDMSTEGGLTWIKYRDGAFGNGHYLYDTERTNSSLNTKLPDAGTTNDNRLDFTSTGFNVKNDGGDAVNASGYDYVSWNFRKAPGFFDVVTYTGNGTSGRTVAHNLGSTPGMIIIKSTTDSENWQVWHRSVTGNLELDSTGAADSSSVRVTAVSSTDFTLATFNTSNATGQTYVAYVFAHDDQSFGTNSNEAIIKCGSYTGDGNSGNPEGNLQNLGFEPQFLLLKNTTRNSDPYSGWHIFDNMRGVTYGKGTSSPTGDDQYIYANKSDAEASDAIVNFTPVGFSFTNSGTGYNRGSDNYIYMAIRRPHKPPTAGTEVFTAAYAAGSQPPAFDSNNHVVDFGIYRRPNTSESWYTTNRLTFPKYMFTNTNQSESSSLISYDYQHGFGSSASSDYFAYMFRRAPGFLDVVTYTGNGSVRTINHNLTVVPEMMIVKRRNSAANWQVYHSSQGNTKYSPSFKTDPFYTSSNRWNNTTPTSTQFTLGTDTDVNGSSDTYVAILFATLDGISKLGSYTGTGSALNVDCGFTNGARFILIKRADTETQGSAPDRTNWYVWDSTRGIASGNDPYWSLNEQDVQVTTTDYIDPLNAGFTVNASGGGLNANGGTYVFLAIA